MMNWEVVQLLVEMSKNESFMTALKQGGLKIDWKAMFDVVAEGAIVADTPLDTPPLRLRRSDTNVPAPVPENPGYPFLTATVTKNSLAKDIADLHEDTSAGSFLGKMLDVIARLEERTRPLLPVTIPYPPTAWLDEPNPYFPGKPSPFISPTVPTIPSYPTIVCNGSETPVSDATGNSEML